MLNAMHTAIVALLLAIVSSSAMAEWLELGSSPTDTLYADPASIRIEGHTARLWALNDFRTAHVLDDGSASMSEKVQYEYDCQKAQWRLVYFSAHSGNMAEGEVVDFNIVPGVWEPIPPESAVEVTWRLACGRA